MSQPSNLEDIFNRRLETIFPSREAAIKRMIDNPQRIYLGIDPTGPLHIGHLVPLLFLKDLASSGHTPVVVIGDFTAMIGDPTDKEKARAALSEEQVRENMKEYIDQIKRVLPQFDVEYNSKWLKTMSLGNVIQLASHVTVQQMLQRDMFQDRLKQERPIYLHEFLYPLMQGYDSVEMEIDGEVGGNDQTFNMLVGRDLMREYLKKDKLVFATKLLVDPVSNKKISKTEGNMIALSDMPNEIRRKVLNFIPDEMTKTIFELCTNKDMEWISAQHTKADPRKFKEDLADELIRMIHGEAFVAQANQPTGASASGLPLAQTLKVWGATSSVAGAKEAITSGGVKINGRVETDWNKHVKPGDKVQVGKGKFYEVE